jgi:tetratricopeptide (TPR) repeat protein
MAMIPLRGIFTKLFPKMLQTNDFKHVWAKISKGQFGEAYTVFHDIIERQPHYSKVGDVYILWAELELLANHDPRKAIELLDKAQEMGCTQMVYYYTRRADALWVTGERHMALQFYEKSVDEDPCAFCLSNLARALSYLNDTRAQTIWQQVLEEDPKNCFAYRYLGWEAAKSGDRNKALLLLKKAETLQSSVRDAFGIGRIYHELEEFQTAINKYLEAKKLGYGEEGVVNAAIADCYLSLGNESAARKYVQLAVQHDPEDD